MRVPREEPTPHGAEEAPEEVAEVDQEAGEGDVAVAVQDVEVLQDVKMIEGKILMFE